MQQVKRYLQWICYGAAAILLRPRLAGEWAYLIIGIVLGAYFYALLMANSKKRARKARNRLIVLPRQKLDA